MAEENSLAQANNSGLVSQELRDGIEKIAQSFDPEDGTLPEDDFEKGLLALSQWLLFETKYDPVVIVNPRIIKKIPNLHNLPLVCKAQACPYHDICPVMVGLTDAQKGQLTGTFCRREREYAIHLFADLVRELEIAPKYTVDIMAATQLVRAYTMKQRIDWQTQLDNLLEEEPAVVDQRTGQVYWKRTVHPLQKLSDQYDKTIGTLLNQLMASRKDRAALAMAMGDKEALFNGLLTGKIGNSRTEAALPVVFTNAEFTILDKDDEE